VATGVAIAAAFVVAFVAGSFIDGGNDAFAFTFTLLFLVPFALLFLVPFALLFLVPFALLFALTGVAAVI
jgi:hypothetical protein